jgi:putative transposon-encoded protein
MPTEKNSMKDEKTVASSSHASRLPMTVHSKVKFEIFGEEMLEKNVKSSGNSGRVYLPPEWIGHRVKIIRID